MLRQLMLLLALATTPSLVSAGLIGEPVGSRTTVSPARAQTWAGQPALKLAGLTTKTADSRYTTSTHTTGRPQAPLAPASLDTNPAAWNGYVPSGPDSAGWWSSY
ncbi:hypothetical protein [Zoogloea sp. LCSB751]|uniref:hypothetical protein n=1 Tax=Zoogloea sp. LCSB751 TaxID=1965277 RepID=UPI001116F408|nr:hypothetical protein [Zoogloea sp. LCSB751]